MYVLHGCIDLKIYTYSICLCFYVNVFVCMYIYSTYFTHATYISIKYVYVCVSTKYVHVFILYIYTHYLHV